MATAALVIALAAFVFALAALARAKDAGLRVQDADSDAKRRLENATKELAESVEVTRRLLAELAAGTPLTRDMVLEGRLWRDVDAAEGKRLVDERAVRVLDVRSAQEVAGGRIPGALHIPIDELEQRRHELPRDGRPMLIYCAGGGRSAAACELLTEQGWTSLLNLEGGIGGWTGPLERPS